MFSGSAKMCKYIHIKKKDNDYYCNKSYFSRIPSHYRNIDSKIGLNIIKEALNHIILRIEVIPKYYNRYIIHDIITIR